MLKRTLIIGFILLFIFSCTSPKNTAKDFLVAVIEGKFETASALVTDESIPILFSLTEDDSYALSDFEVEIHECASFKENEVTCIYTITHSAKDQVIQRETIRMVKEKNQWKVDLTNP